MVEKFVGAAVVGDIDGTSVGLMVGSGVGSLVSPTFLSVLFDAE